MLSTVLEDTVNVVREITYEDVRHAFIVQAAGRVCNPSPAVHRWPRRRYEAPGATITKVPQGDERAGCPRTSSPNHVDEIGRRPGGRCRIVLCAHRATCAALSRGRALRSLGFGRGGFA